jgi:broad-specificity NMP kinase
MITIIEGVDGTGKTTYAKKLAADNKLTYLHADKPTQKTWYEEYLNPIKHQHMVLDRWHLGELVWPTIYGRKSLFDDDTFDLCNWTLSKLGTKLIVLTRNDDDIVNELLDRGEEDQVDIVMHAKELFMQAYKKVKYIDKQIIESGVVHVPSN